MPCFRINPCRFWGYALIFLFIFMTLFFAIYTNVKHRRSHLIFVPTPTTTQDSPPDFITLGLPGAPRKPEYSQFSGYITVDEANGRSLFYYFVETSAPGVDPKPIILWLNGGPGCSSVGIGAFMEIGPYGVQKDGSTLYAREHSWTSVANLLFLESPIGVGFSYSNTSSDYDSMGNLRAASDSYIFVKKWLARFPQYKGNDFHIAGEGFAGYYIPDLAYLIMQSNFDAPTSSTIKLKGIMIGNPHINAKTDEQGVYDFLWGHMLISNQTYQGLIKNCINSDTLDCVAFQNKTNQERGPINIYNIYDEACPSNKSEQVEVGGRDPCEGDYVTRYLNIPEVQKALHANMTGLPYAWGLCSRVNEHWKDSPAMVPVYKRLLEAKLPIFLYSGDVDGVVPVTSTYNSISKMGLTITVGWRPWFDDMKKLAGHRVDYKEGLTFMTVLGAGHEVPRYRPREALSLVKLYLEGT